MVKNSELIKDFVNTRDLLDDEEALATPAALGSWCAAHGLLGGDTRPTSADLRHALELREALRSLLLANNGVEVDLTAANAALDQAVQRARVELAVRRRTRRPRNRVPQESRLRSAGSRSPSMGRWPTAPGSG